MHYFASFTALSNPKLQTQILQPGCVMSNKHCFIALERFQNQDQLVNEGKLLNSVRCFHACETNHPLTLLHSESPQLYTIWAFLCVIGSIRRCMVTLTETLSSTYSLGTVSKTGHMQPTLFRSIVRPLPCNNRTLGKPRC